MTIFAVTYRYSDDVATRDNLRTEHRDYLRRDFDYQRAADDHDATAVTDCDGRGERHVQRRRDGNPGAHLSMETE